MNSQRERERDLLDRDSNRESFLPVGCSYRFTWNHLVERFSILSRFDFNVISYGVEPLETELLPVDTITPATYRILDGT